MGQCVSSKADAVIAASGRQNSPSYKIMEKPARNKGTAKRGRLNTRGTAMSFGFRKRPTTTGIPVPITNYGETVMLHPRSKSAGSEQERKRGGDNDGEDNAQGYIHNTSSGRSTPRLLPPKKEASGIAVRTNRFGFRQSQAKFSNKVGDLCASSPNPNYFTPEKPTSQQQEHHHHHHYHHYHHHHLQGEEDPAAAALKGLPKTVQGSTTTTTTPPLPLSKVRLVTQPANNNTTRLSSGIPEPISRYTLHTSHLPQPQYAVRMTDANSKIAKTVVNQSRKVSGKDCGPSKDGSGTEDSGIGSQRGTSKQRNLKMVVHGKSFDVRDVQDDDITVTEISVIQLPKIFVNPNTTNTGLVRERTTRYQRILNKDNRYTSDSVTSRSTTSSEGYDEGLGEEKVYKDRSRSEKKIPSIKSNFSQSSSDDPEYGIGEAMADEYSLSSNDDCQQRLTESMKQLKTTSNNSPKNVYLTIEDPAFAAVAATSMTLIDDETSPVDSLFGSPTASITISDAAQTPKKELYIMEKIDKNMDDESPGTPTNASNSLSLSEGREYFDDEIADQPGLVFNDRTQLGIRSGRISQGITETSHTLMDSLSKPSLRRGNSIENSPLTGRKISRTGSIDTLSPCESIASDDLMMDYERSETNSYDEGQHRRDSHTALHELDEATILSELENQGEEVMRQWSSLLGTSRLQHQANSNSTNNNINNTDGVDNNNHPTSESGIASGRTSRLLRSRSGTESPKSLDNVRIRQVGSPLRTPRGLQSPNLDSGDEASLRIERGTYQHMFQDIVSIKTMLLKLKRVVQEPGENSLTRAETLNPFDNSTKNGLFFNLNEGDTTNFNNLTIGENKTNADELVDLRRQVIFLQGQLQDRDRMIQTLQLQLSKLSTSKTNENHNYLSSNNFDNISTPDTCNAATQTEKTRPISSGPSLLHALPQDSNMGPLVSWSDIRNHKNLSGKEPKKNQHNFHNGHVDTSAMIIESPPREKNIEVNDTRQEDTDDNFLKKSYIPNVRNLIKATTLKQLENNVSIIDDKYSA